MKNTGFSDVLEPAYKTTGSHKPEVRNIDHGRPPESQLYMTKGIWRISNAYELCWMQCSSNFVFILLLLIKIEGRSEFKTFIYLRIEGSYYRLLCCSTTITVPLSIVLFLQQWNLTVESDANLKGVQKQGNVGEGVESRCVSGKRMEG